ncbi:uncharacterized protein DUF3396 [Pseudoduganella flava]|uniref:DUF3396 domain-containing protein n=1 Tax=Pseudoduganella flava TaxID=871742 RepID=A0A562Q432_9BURK|nr:type VI immunity family protein [Pseudoduganella flava]QGZ41520.1 DUF3396 domain-containing protein [Pseudoduganella flava]TWI51492.1 uncharacterized protein DUF3396 [Pseudoduganella flava]
MSELPYDPVQLMREHPEQMRVPGALMSKKGPQDYVGCVPAITGTLFFKGAHLPEVREAICNCFDLYAALAGDRLTWLWRDEPPVGPDKYAYTQAPSLREMMKQLRENDFTGFTYVSGTQPHDAGEWEFSVFGLRGWQADMGDWGLSALRFAMPLLQVEDNPTVFQSLFVSFATRLRAIHGHGGHGLVLSAVRVDENQPFEAFMSAKLNGLDVGDTSLACKHAHEGIKTVSWLTAISQEIVEEIGGLPAIRSELPLDWFALYDYKSGIVIQSGPKPEAAPVDVDPRPARLVLPNALLRPFRAPKVALHTGSKYGEPRIVGLTADQWLKRFDVEEGEIIAYKRKLLDEPKLSETSTLPARL